MYLKSANTFVNVRDIKTMYVNSDAQVIIVYMNNSGEVTLNCNNASDAQDTLMLLARRAEQVQSLGLD